VAWGFPSCLSFLRQTSCLSHEAGMISVMNAILWFCLSL
jgi:hypothetical protein